MPLTLPCLDDRTWEELTEESRRRIPAYASGWTNHNAADPGITLIELFASHCESFLYRIDQVGPANKSAFLKLINGPGWQSGGNMQDDIKATVADLRRPHRAVTPEDFESLAMSIDAELETGSKVKVGRAKCLSRMNLRTAGSRPAQAAGHVTVLIVPDPADAPTEPLLWKVKSVLENARLIGTRLHVLPARYVDVGVRLSIVAERSVSTDEVKRAALQKLTGFFDTMHGGPDGAGWPFGRSVYVSEIYQLLVKVPGIKKLGQIRDRASEKPLDELILSSRDDSEGSGRGQRNRFGELEAIELQSFELVRFKGEDAEITVTHESKRSISTGSEDLSSNS